MLMSEDLITIQQLDIFKLDMIARELKKLDQSLGLIRDEARGKIILITSMLSFSTYHTVSVIVLAMASHTRVLHIIQG